VSDKGTGVSVLATLADVLFSGLIVGCVCAIATWRSRGELDPLILLSSITVAVVLPSIYHIFLARRSFWMSPGELLIGCEWDGDRKHWANPYRRARGLLFTMQFVTLIFLASLWPSAVLDRFLTPGRIVVAGALSFVVGRGLIHWGRGERLGGYIVVGYYAVLAVGLIAEARGGRFFLPNLNNGMPVVPASPVDAGAMMGVLAGLALVVTLVYAPRGDPLD
jgi:hypothetical protein